MNTAFFGRGIWEVFFFLFLSVDFIYFFRAVFHEKAIYAEWPPNPEGAKAVKKKSPACLLMSQTQSWVAAG